MQPRWWSERQLAILGGGIVRRKETGEQQNEVQSRENRNQDRGLSSQSGL
jgi:hypothetical protein